MVDLRPWEMVFFNGSGVKHYTEKHPGSRWPETEAWAVSCFFQRRVREQRLAEEGVAGEEGGAIDQAKSKESSERQ